MKKVAEQAQHDLDCLLKLAATRKGINWEWAKSVAAPLLGTLAAAGTTGLAAYYFSKKDRERHEQDLTNSLNVLRKSPELAKKEPQKLIERFGELTVISPTIAKSPTLAAKLLQNKIDTGFDPDDIHRLTAIESGVAHQGGIHPGAAGMASAASTFRTMVQTFGPTMYHHIHESTKKRGRQLEDLEKKEEEQNLEAMAERFADKMMKKTQAGSMEKKSSEQRVSDECLGQMLAERFILLKTAGVGDLLAGGAKRFGEQLLWAAPALALGGGIELVRQAIESRRNRALEDQADKNFKVIMKDSDVAKGNPQIALEAFNTLKAVAPSLAARPLVANTFIDHVVTQGRLAPDTVQQIAEAENQVRGIGAPGQKRPSFGFMSELKGAMGLMESKSDMPKSRTAKKGYLK